ncbi:MAG: cytochrome P450 [Aeromicrobium sp.]
MNLPPVHEVTGFAALRQLRASQVGFFASTYQPGRDVVRVRIGPPGLAVEAYLTHSPEAAQKLLSAKSYTDFPKENRVYRQIRLIMGDGLLTSWGEDWRRQKALIQPIFTRARVEGYLDPILDELDGAIGHMRAEGSTVDLGALMMRYTLKVVCRVLFGAGLTTEQEDRVMLRFAALNASVIQRANTPMPFGLPLPMRGAVRTNQAELFELCDDVIAQRRGSNSDGDDLVGLLIAARDGEDQLSDQEIREQILVFMLAGHETTSASLTFALHLLGRHPDIQQRVRDEVKRVMGDDPPTAMRLMADLPYTTAVLKEAMRLYPAAPITARRSLEDTTIGGHDIPAGSDIVLCVWSIHHRADLWPEPEQFKPERFLHSTEIGRYDWMPFGAGPRACIGQHFSMLESLATLAVLVRDFEFSAPEASSDTVSVGSGITLFPIEPVLSHVTVRG